MRKRISCLGRRRSGFTLLQLVIVMAVIAILTALLFGAYKSRLDTARQSECDVKLKAIALALDAYRQENGRYPATLTELVTRGYLNSYDDLRCPSDPRPLDTGATALANHTSGTYADFYVIRAPHDSVDLPVVVCPFHEGRNHGEQAFLGRGTGEYQVAPATLSAASGATIEHPDGKGASAALVGMALHGGDRVRTSGGGSAVLQFADGSTATVSGGSDVTVLQSFLDGATTAPLYTVLRQDLGDIDYKVHSGSKFDVVTPTATASARGTEFEIQVSGGELQQFKLISGKAVLTTLSRSAWVLNPLQVVGTITNLLDGLSGLTGLL